MKTVRTKTPKRQKGESLPKTILVPLDFSETNDLVLRNCKVWATTLKARLILLHVVEPMIYPPEAGFVPVDEEKVKQASLRRLRQVVGLINDAAVKAKAMVRLGSPYHEICQAAREQKAELIVISTHGYTGLRHVLMGSTAERVVRHAPCPVLVIK